MIALLEVSAARQYAAKLKAEKEQNGDDRMSDIQGKVAREAMSEWLTMHELNSCSGGRVACDSGYSGGRRVDRSCSRVSSTAAADDLTFDTAFT